PEDAEEITSSRAPRARLELPPHPRRDWRTPGNGERVRQDTPGKCGQNVPRLGSVDPARFPRYPARRGSKSGQNVRQLRVKTGQNVPRLAPALAVRRGGLSDRHSRETRRRSEPAADLAGP